MEGSILDSCFSRNQILAGCEFPHLDRICWPAARITNCGVGNYAVGVVSRNRVRYVRLAPGHSAHGTPARRCGDWRTSLWYPAFAMERKLQSTFSGWMPTFHKPPQEMSCPDIGAFTFIIEERRKVSIRRIRRARRLRTRNSSVSLGGEFFFAGGLSVQPGKQLPHHFQRLQDVFSIWRIRTQLQVIRQVLRSTYILVEVQPDQGPFAQHLGGARRNGK
jgi:hypothetical protein